MLMNLLASSEVVRHSAPVAAGSTVITPSGEIDMQGFEGCLFIVPFGAITATGVQSIEVHGSNTSGSGFTALEGTNVVVADDDDNKYAMVEVIRPQHRYLKCVVNRATANSAIDGIVAVKHGAAKQPTTQPDHVAADPEIHAGPDAGTA